MTTTEAMPAMIGHRLREARLQARLTTREAAQAAGLRSHTTLVQYENGRVLPPLDRLVALARAYGIAPASLLLTHDALAPLVAQLDTLTAVELATVIGLLTRAIGEARRGGA